VLNHVNDMWGRGEGGGTCEAGVCLPQSCARAAPCMKSGRGLAHLNARCFLVLPHGMRQGWHVVEHLRSGRMGASGRPALRLPLRQGLARRTRTKHDGWIRVRTAAPRV